MSSVERIECQKASRRLRDILQCADQLDVTLYDLAQLPGVKKLLAPRAHERSRLLQILPVICTVIVFALYCYCIQEGKDGRQSLAGHYDDMVSTDTVLSC
jgi:hypothetical protein